MSEKKYERKIQFQKDIISRQSEQIESLKLQIEKLKLECEKKDLEIKSVSLLRDELAENVLEMKKYKNEYKELIGELRNMKKVVNKEVYNNKWSLIKFLAK